MTRLCGHDRCILSVRCVHVGETGENDILSVGLPMIRGARLFLGRHDTDHTQRLVICRTCDVEHGGSLTATTPSCPEKKTILEIVTRTKILSPSAASLSTTTTSCCDGKYCQSIFRETKLNNGRCCVCVTYAKL